MSDLSDRVTALLDLAYRLAALDGQLAVARGAEIGPVTITMPGQEPGQAEISVKAAEIIRAQLVDDISGQIKKTKAEALVSIDEIRATLKAE